MEILIEAAKLIIDEWVDGKNSVWILSDYLKDEKGDRVLEYKAVEIVRKLQDIGMLQPPQGIPGKQIKSQPAKLLIKDINKVKELLTQLTL